MEIRRNLVDARKTLTGSNQGKRDLILLQIVNTGVVRNRVQQNHTAGVIGLRESFQCHRFVSIAGRSDNIIIEFLKLRTDADKDVSEKSALIEGTALERANQANEFAFAAHQCARQFIREIPVFFDDLQHTFFCIGFYLWLVV